MLNKLNLKVVTIAFIVCFCVNYVVNICVTLLFRSVDLLNHAYSPFSGKFYKNLAQDPKFLISIFIVSTATYAFSGFLVARKAKKFPTYNALAIGLIWLACDLIILATLDHPYGLIDVIDMLCTVPLAFIGGYLAQEKDVY